MEGFTQGVAAMGFPAPEVFAWAAALSEFAGGILLALGLFTRWAALFVFMTMFVAVFIKHADDPLKKKELAMAYWSATGALACLGAGKFSFDAIIRKKS